MRSVQYTSIQSMTKAEWKNEWRIGRENARRLRSISQYPYIITESSSFILIHIDDLLHFSSASSSLHNIEYLNCRKMSNAGTTKRKSPPTELSTDDQQLESVPRQLKIQRRDERLASTSKQPESTQTPDVVYQSTKVSQSTQTPDVVHQSAKVSQSTQHPTSFVKGQKFSINSDTRHHSSKCKSSQSTQNPTSFIKVQKFLNQLRHPTSFIKVQKLLLLQPFLSKAQCTRNRQNYPSRHSKTGCMRANIVPALLPQTLMISSRSLSSEAT